MALKEVSKVDKIEIVGEHKCIQVRTATVIEKDGVEITRTFHRHVISPSDDASDESKDVSDAAKLYHTKAVKDAYKKSIKEAK